MMRPKYYATGIHRHTYTELNPLMSVLTKFVLLITCMLRYIVVLFLIKCFFKFVVFFNFRLLDYPALVAR